MEKYRIALDITLMALAILASACNQADFDPHSCDETRNCPHVMVQASDGRIAYPLNLYYHNAEDYYFVYGIQAHTLQVWENAGWNEEVIREEVTPRAGVYPTIVYRDETSQYPQFHFYSKWDGAPVIPVGNRFAAFDISDSNNLEYSLENADHSFGTPKPILPEPGPSYYSFGFTNPATWSTTSDYSVTTVAFSTASGDFRTGAGSSLEIVQFSGKDFSMTPVALTPSDNPATASYSAKLYPRGLGTDSLGEPWVLGFQGVNTSTYPGLPPRNSMGVYRNGAWRFANLQSGPMALGAAVNPSNPQELMIFTLTYQPDVNATVSVTRWDIPTWQAKGPSEAVTSFPIQFASVSMANPLAGTDAAVVTNPLTGEQWLKFQLTLTQVNPDGPPASVSYQVYEGKIVAAGLEQFMEKYTVDTNTPQPPSDDNVSMVFFKN